MTDDEQIIKSILETEVESMKRRWPKDMVCLGVVLLRSSEPNAPMIFGDMSLGGMVYILKSVLNAQPNEVIFEGEDKPIIN